MFMTLIIALLVHLVGVVDLAVAGVVEIRGDQLYIDGGPRPQLWGAEVQYFRLRGGSNRNVPREVVISLWAQALDRAVEAHMNTISFYIPWDFHEYAEGKFDFDGRADEDGDGRPDYPSRDVRTFIKMIKERGIDNIMVRPGPYINAEWGFLGFGAIPLWFHQKYPNSHARNSKGQRTTLYNYEDPDFLRHTQLWFKSVYQQVLRDDIGPGKAISFLQIDNETNLMWQSIYNHDYGALAVEGYQQYLQSRYSTLAALNAHHQRQWRSWGEIRPPAVPGKKINEDQDWHRYQDYRIFIYLGKIRKMWENLGVVQPTVLFTLAESYNAAENGLLPHYQWRNSPSTGMMTVNLYPKTYETWDQTLLNLPFKADHDVKAADAASDFYLGKKEEWVMGPEIQGGWWRGINVSEEARRQTYLTTLGHGLKGLLIYYFNEGGNWQHNWMREAIAPYFYRLSAAGEYEDYNEQALPDRFWRELDTIVAENLLVVDTRGVWRNGGTHPETLYFDAPLGADAKPRPPYNLVKEIGEKIIAPYGNFLGSAHALEDPVCVIKDSSAHVPSPIQGVNSRIVQSDWTAGLLGVLMHSGINAKIHHWGIAPTSDLLDRGRCRLVIYQDNGLASPELTSVLTEVVTSGGTLLNFIHDGVTMAILNKTKTSQNSCSRLIPAPMDVVGYSCAIGAGTLYQAKVPIYDVFNTDFYYQIHDAKERRAFFDQILMSMNIIPHVRIKGGGDRTVLFARANPSEDKVWITVKSARRDGFMGKIQWTKANSSERYLVTDVLGGTATSIEGSALRSEGFPVTLGGSGSGAFFIEAKR
ncbi:MAG: beta-galactosidase [Oligoflexia bacterium]|nr:beta-galactosidase [Oligoflexia bacterium]MBF0367255.1 beta-galactosidase [Oligoflexia bacterium]